MTLNSKLIYLKFIAQSIKFLKDHKVYHLDLKPLNILWNGNHTKLTDFGEAYHP
jgi:serine/threonine protein kinase